MKKVLICDDEPAIREALKEFMEGEEYEVALAEDGKKALGEFGKGKFDVVFMDVNMPGIDGIECMREMKKLKPEIKVVIITGLADETTFDRAISVPEDAAEGFIAKPFKPDDLRKVLENIDSGKTVSAFQMTPSQLAAMNNLAEAGAENASHTFSEILKKETQLQAEKIRIVPFSRIAGQGDGEEVNAGILIGFSGEISGGILILFFWETGLEMIDLMEKRPSGTTTIFNQSSHRILETAGNILAASYLNAINASLGISVNPDMPELMFDKRGKILEAAGKKFALTESVSTAEYVFSVENELSIAGTNIKGYLLFIPDGDSVKTILKTQGTLG